MLEAVEKQFMKIEDDIIGLSNPISTTNPDTTQNNFYTNLLKNRISEWEKQLEDKNAIIDFLSAQIISKPPDLQKYKRVVMVKLVTNLIMMESH